MQIEILNEFVTLAQTLNYREASERLFITQPTLSKHVKELETQLGARLFNRGTKSVSITKEGASFLECAQQICQLYSTALHKLRQDSNNKIVAGVPLIYPFYSRVIRAAIDRTVHELPEFQCSVVDIGMNGEPPEFLAKGCDVVMGFCLENNAGGDLEVVELCKQPVYLWVANTNPLAGADEASISDLNGMVFRPSSPNPRYPWSVMVQGLFKMHGIAPIMGEAVDALYQLGPNDFALVFGGAPDESIGFRVCQVPLQEHLSVPISATYRSSQSTALLLQFVSTLAQTAQFPASKERGTAPGGGEAVGG